MPTFEELKARTARQRAEKRAARQTPEKFFYEFAGSSYRPDVETKEQGKQRGAARLAAAEAWARDEGYSFEWKIDPEIDSSEWIEPREDGGKYRDPWTTWVCVIHGPEGHVAQSLHGIDFGRDGSPWGDPYRRVVEAELALEEMPE